MNKHQFKQWTLNVEDEKYELFNPGTNGVQQFYNVTPGAYGQPVITAEPSLAFAVPEALTYVNFKGEPVVPAEKIAGIICQEADGTAVYRFSLSSPKAPRFQIVSYGIIIDDVSWHLCTLFSKDKNRVINYDAFYRREKCDVVRLIELADLNFVS